MKAQPFEYGRKEHRVLEAVAAAPSAHQLVLQAGDVEAHVSTQQDVEVLEWDRGHVRPNDARQDLVRRARRTTPTDALEIRVEVECIRQSYFDPDLVRIESARRPAM